jgi:hypothetical protein
MINWPYQEIKCILFLCKVKQLKFKDNMFINGNGDTFKIKDNIKYKY